MPPDSSRPDDLHPDEDLHPGTPDVVALRRRVLVTGVLTLLAWVGAVVVLDAVGLRGPLYALVAAALIYVAVVRPLMRPVREAIALRRRLAYQSWLDAREADDDGPPRG
ncbi:MAG TPA: hypothetical protein VM433_07065 [Mycobacteriales bacterium]|nr:hypothetical protein [Mycobacteriales bacterium]